MITATPAGRKTLEQLGLDSLQAVRSFKPALLVKDHNGKRDVCRIERTDSSGQREILYLKRLWRVAKKDGFKSLLRFGRVRSVSKQEFLNCQALSAAGVPVSEVVACGEELKIMWERFSFILTASAKGSPLEDFLKESRLHNQSVRRVTLRKVALFVRGMHDKGFFFPDLFTRHIFVDQPGKNAQLSLIDVARLDVSPSRSDKLRARDLAALNVSAPMSVVRPRERARFLLTYDLHGRRLLPQIRRRSLHLLKRPKFQSFFDTCQSQPKALAARA